MSFSYRISKDPVAFVLQPATLLLLNHYKGKGGENRLASVSDGVGKGCSAYSSEMTGHSEGPVTDLLLPDPSQGLVR